MYPSDLDWDDGNRSKCEKHDVSIAEIESLFRGRPRYAPDRKHSATENRFIAVGRTAEGRAMFVAFTFRESDGRLLVRPVSARYMHAKEADRYGQ
jgi:uncharacterized DUF497 family protein